MRPSPTTVALFHVTLCGKTLRAGTYGEAVPACLGQAERSWALRHSMAQLAASPSVQGPDACVPGTHLGDARQPGPGAQGAPLSLGTSWGTRLQCAHLALGTHKHRSVYLINY